MKFWDILATSAVQRVGMNLLGDSREAGFSTS